MKCINNFWLVAALIVASGLSASGQSLSTDTGTDATPLLSSVFKAVLGGAVVKSIQLSGNATWTLGSETEQGTVTASADNTGTSSLQLSGGINRTETETAIGAGRVCQWSGADNKLHPIASLNCLKPMEWLFPALTLQPGLTPASAGFLDFGLSSFNIGQLRRLQAQLVIPGIPIDLQPNAMRSTTMNLGVDPASFLPRVLTYRVHPDSGAMLEITIEIRYSDYRKIGNAEIPFHIQRYINGTLQLDLQITSATLS